MLAVRLLLPCLILAPTLPLAAQVPWWLEPDRVLVVYNTNWPDEDGNGRGESEDLALAYQAKRGVPAQNLVPVACSTNQYYYWQLAGWTSFWNEVRDPVVQKLQAVGQTSITTILFCRGVPYALSLGSANGGLTSLDHCMMTPFALGTSTATVVSGNTLGFWLSPYFDQAPGYAAGLPHYSHQYTFQGTRYYLVARLDGNSHDHALDLIEGALYGDLYVSPTPGYYQGRAYVDTRFDGYPDPTTLPWPSWHNSYQNADRDMARVTVEIEPIGFDLWWENTPNSLEIGEPGATYRNGQSAATAPDALFYYGWYNYNTYRDVWTWLPGSAASDLDSNSVAGIRTGSTSFGESALDRGLTCCVGVIAEPYLGYHPWPETFIQYLMTGRTFAEAAAASDRAQKFKSLFIGDPLYCPMLAGKVPALDTVPPPTPDVTGLQSSGGALSFRAALDTSGREPDLVTIGGAWGAAPALARTLDHGGHHRVARTVTLSGPVPGAFHRAVLVARDPVGNETPLPEILWIEDGGAGVAALVQSASATPSTAVPLTVEFALRVPGGVANLTSLSMSVDVQGVTIDLLPLLPVLSTTLHVGVDPEVVSLELVVPAGYPAGTWTFALGAVTTSGAAADGLTLTAT